jgi:hypothetical protein
MGAVLILALISRAAGAAPSSLTYYINVAASGNATVVMVFASNGSGAFYTYVPRFEPWSVTVWRGAIAGKRVENSSAYFYYNATFEYLVDETGAFGMNISFRFPFASLYAGERGWFMTPLLGAPPGTTVTVVVTIEGLGSVLDVSLDNAMVRYSLDGNTLKVQRISLRPGGSRVTVDYRLARPVEETTMELDANVTLVRVRAAPYYKGLARAVAGVVGKAVPYLRDIFGYSPSSVDFELFLPTRMDLSALGYVMGEDINAGGEGPIHLNLALLRFKEGYLETTVVHELVHKALGALGVPANRELRWFHEGVAQYVSVKICEKIGIDVSDAEASLESAARVFGSGLAKPGFVQRWTPSGDEGSYYAASYYVVATLAEERGGLSYIKRVASEIRRRGGVSNNQDLVEALSAAAGEDLAPRFRDWGFEVSETRVAAVPRLAAALAAAALAAAVAFSLLVILLWRRRGERCPYCYGEVPRGAAYCPYCGYPLRARSDEGYSAS